MYGGGQQVRDFVYLSDVVDSLIKAAETSNINRQVINIGSGTGTSIAKLVDVMESVINKKINRIVNSERTTGVTALIGDISKANELLGYQPQVSLEDGLARMVREDNRFS